MAWINEYLKRRVIVTTHARERWEERFGDTDMGPTIAKALPFGAQNGPSLMLKHDDAVLVVKNDENGLVAITTLTAAQAMANMHVYGYDPRIIHEPMVKPKHAADNFPIVAKLNDKDVNAKAGGFVSNAEGSLSTASDEELEALAAKSKEMVGMVSSKVRGKINTLLNQIDKERSIRKRIAKAQEHANRMHRERTALKQAICDVVPDMRQAVMDRAEKIIALLGDKVGTPGWQVLLELAEEAAPPDGVSVNNTAELTTAPASAQ